MGFREIFFSTKTKSGFTYGIIATFVMTLIMLTGMSNPGTDTYGNREIYLRLST